MFYSYMVESFINKGTKKQRSTHSVGLLKLRIFHEMHTCFLLLQVLGVIIYLNFSQFCQQFFYSLIFAAVGILLVVFCYRPKRSVGSRIFLLLPLALLLGILSMHVRVVQLNTHFIEAPIKNIEIIGTVKEVKDFEEKIRVLVEVENCKDIKRIRVKSRDFSVKEGDKVRFFANLFPPPSIMLHDAFNFYFYFYFHRIDAIGYVINNFEILRASNGSEIINSFRNNVEKATYSSLPKTNAKVINSLITGNANGLNKALKERIRNIGVAHVFAISGMHMGIIIAISFFAFRLLFKRISYFLLRYNIQKIAAIFALVFGFFYLMLSNFTLSAQRAYVMSFIFLLSILFDRKLHLFRSLSIAGIVILVITPEALLHPGMQMSFAACLGLIAIYERYVIGKLNAFGWAAKTTAYFTMLISSTLIATVFTMPFSIYHFQNLATASLIANFIIVPITEFLIMPICMLYMVLIPINLEFLLVFPAKISTNIMLAAIEWVYNLGLPNLFVPKIHPISLLIFILLGISVRLFNYRVWMVLIALIFSVEYVHFGASYNIIYSAQSKKLVQIDSEQLKIYGDFSKIEIKVIESYFNKKCVRFTKEDTVPYIPSKLSANGVYYLNIRGGIVYSYKLYPQKMLPWSSRVEYIESN